MIGHNLKIAWNLMRINSLRPSDKYVDLARKIGELMPTVGMDKQRGGWYDVMERVTSEGEEWHRVAWHDRKAWWQQEQAILAFLILTGILGEEYRNEARHAGRRKKFRGHEEPFSHAASLTKVGLGRGDQILPMNSRGT